MNIQEFGSMLGAAAITGGSFVTICLATGCTPPPGPAVAVVDHHVHIRTQASADHLDRLDVELDGKAGEGEGSSALTAADVLAALDTAGIQRGVVLSNAYLFAMPDVAVEDEYAKVQTENDYVASQVALHGDRLAGFCSVNPLREYAEKEVLRCVGDDRIRGLKLHLTNSDVDLRNPDHTARLVAMLTAVERMGGAAVVHMRTRAEDYGAEDARIFIDDVLSRAPDVPVHIAHVGGWGGYDDATDAALGVFAEAIRDGRLRSDRITFGLGAVVFEPAAAGADTALANQVQRANEQLADRMREIGIDRFVYATDWPSWPPVQELDTGIRANVELVRSALPLTDQEMRELFQNSGVVWP